MSDPRIDRLMRSAQLAISHGNRHSAIEYIREALTLDPSHGNLHALLATVLVDEKRLHAADLESMSGLANAPDSDFCHYARARVLFAQRKINEGLEHLDQALALNPLEGDYYRAKAQFLIFKSDRAGARECLIKALELEPDNPNNLAALGHWHLYNNEPDRAEELAQRALEMQADCLDALVLMGHVALHRGQMQEARDHCGWALRQDPMDPGTIQLLCAIKARSSWLLGLWWRFNSSLILLSQGWIIFVLIGMFVAATLARMIAADFGQVQLAEGILYTWLAFCVYTWVAPRLFVRMIRKEIEKVSLNPNF